ncbi:MAG: hypothetical protein JXA97_04345 [Anaerolineales bacterium]|nr:hypothetical protein [Anaerolineales bacterium]
MTDKAVTISRAAFFAGILLLAGSFIFFIGLGQQPLGNEEAAYALGALGSRAENQTTADPMYATLTSGLFSIFGPSEGLARFIPALAGFGIFLLPLLFHKKMGWGPVLLLQTGVLISPVLVSSARTAGSGNWTLLILLGLAIFGEIELDRELEKKIAAVLLGAVICTGPDLYQGLLAILLSMLLLVLAGERRLAVSLLSTVKTWIPHLGLTALTVFLLSSQFGLNLNQLSTLWSGLDGWLNGWKSGQSSLLAAFLMLPIYEPLFLLCGAAGAVFTVRRKQKWDLVAIAAAVGGFIAFLIYPGRTALDLIWVSAPLMWLSVRYLVSWIEKFEDSPPVAEYLSLSSALLILVGFAFLQYRSFQSGRGLTLDMGISTEQLLISAVLMAAFCIAVVILYWRNARKRSWIETIIISAVVLAVVMFAFLQFSAITQGPNAVLGMETGLRLRFWSIVGALLLAAIIIVLTGMGWSWSLAGKVAGTAALTLFMLITVSTMARLNFPAEGDPMVEHFRPVRTGEGMRRLEETLTAIAIRASGREDTLEIITFGEVPPALMWTLKKYSTTRENVSAAPQVILFPANRIAPILPGEYRGQTLALFFSQQREYPEPPTLSELIAPAQVQEQWVLLVRSDLATISPSSVDSDEVWE